LKINAQKADGSGKWAGELSVNVLDTIPPTLVVKPFHTELDLSEGMVTLNVDDFISMVDDNCGLAEISIDKQHVSYAEAGEPVDVEITVVDKSGNKVSRHTQLFISVKDIVLGLPGPPAQVYYNLKIYPNPSSGLTEVEIQTGEADPAKSIKIYDLNGKELTSMAGITHSGPTGFMLDISRLASGTYLFLVEGNQQQFFLGRMVKK